MFCLNSLHNFLVLIYFVEFQKSNFVFDLKKLKWFFGRLNSSHSWLIYPKTLINYKFENQSKFFTLKNEKKRNNYLNNAFIISHFLNVD